MMVYVFLLVVSNITYAACLSLHSQLFVKWPVVYGADCNL